MSNVIKIRKGHNIRLLGQAEQVYGEAPKASHYALLPHDFPGIIPKLMIREGDEVQAGDPVFHSKADSRVRFCAPVSGEIAEVVRGDKRKILAIRILADGETRYRDFGSADPLTESREAVIEKMLDSGAWTLMKMRPYGRVASPDDKPKAIFISAVGSAPLSPDMDFIVQGQEEEFQTGINALRRLTEGKVHLSLEANTNPSAVYTRCQGVELHHINGPHPAGNVGVQIHKIDPLNKSEVVWTMTPQDVIILGRLFRTGKYDMRRNVAMTGSEVDAPRYYKLVAGQSLKELFTDTIKKDHVRYISGNPLTGHNCGADGYLGYYDDQLTVLPEGDQTEFLGWVLPGFGKFSLSRTFWSWLTPNKKFRLDTNLHGEERAFVVTGEYERVFPFDIYPQLLIKSIMYRDLEQMENLGIYEVIEEDFALCEVGCTSKTPLQEIVREGLDFLYNEMN